MPNGGFRGDWYLGIVNGSVSINLGRQLIDTLTTKSEEYNRLLNGVGLPTHKSFYDDTTTDFKLWKNAKNNLKDIHDNIYANAHSRSDISDYLKLRIIINRTISYLVYELSELPEGDALTELIKDELSKMFLRMNWFEK